MRTAAAVLLVTLASRAQEEPPPDAGMLVLGMNAAYAALDTYAVHGTQRIEPIGGMRSLPFGNADVPVVRAFRLWFDRERGWRFESRMRLEMAVAVTLTPQHVALWKEPDGIHLWRRNRHPSVFRDAGRAIDATDERVDGLAGLFLRQLLDLTGDGDAFGVVAGEPTYGPSAREEIDGVPCWRVSYRDIATGGGTPYSCTSTLWIDAETFLLRRVAWSSIRTEGDTGTRWLIRIEDDPSEAIPDAQLAFVPPERGGVLEFGGDPEWDFAFETGARRAALDLPRWLPWALLGGGGALALVFVVVLRRAARGHAASRRRDDLPSI